MLIKVFQPAFFAREDMKTPMWFSFASVAANIGLSLALFPYYGHVAIALATSLSSWANVLLLAATLWLRRDFRPSGVTLRRVAMIVFASAVMGGVTHALHLTLPLQDAGSGLRAAGIFLIIAVAGVVYLALATLTGAIDRTELTGALKRRRSSGNPA